MQLCFPDHVGSSSTLVTSIGAQQGSIPGNLLVGMSHESGDLQLPTRTFHNKKPIIVIIIVIFNTTRPFIFTIFLGLDNQYVIPHLVNTLRKQGSISSGLSPYNATKTPQENSQSHDDDSASYDDKNGGCSWQEQFVHGIQ